MEEHEKIEQNFHNVNKYKKYYGPFSFIIDLHKFSILITLAVLTMFYFRDSVSLENYKLIVFILILQLFGFLSGDLAASSTDADGFKIFNFFMFFLVVGDLYFVELYRNPDSTNPLRKILVKNYNVVIYLIGASAILKLFLIYLGDKLRHYSERLEKPRLWKIIG